MMSSPSEINTSKKKNLVENEKEKKRKPKNARNFIQELYVRRCPMQSLVTLNIHVFKKSDSFLVAGN